ncbi:MAG: protoporphyrinogen oxidase [Kineosporiaceae bacterium]
MTLPGPSPSTAAPAPPPSPAGPRLVVVGAGVSGLVAALRLAQEHGGPAVEVLEASDRVGGLLAPAPEGLVPGLDVGAESLLARRPEAVELVRSVGLGGRLVTPRTSAPLILHDGRLHAVPGRTLLGVPAEPALLRPLLDDVEVARVEAEPRESHRPWEGEDASLAEAIGTRLGPAVLRRLVEPLLGGVYAGRVERLGVRAVMPALWPALREGMSLVETVRRLRPPAPPTPASPPEAVFAGLEGGVHQLASALARTLHGLGVTVRTGVRAASLRPRTGGGWQVETGDGASRCADAVVLAVPSPVAAALLRDPVPAAARALGEVATADVAVVAVRLPAGTLPGALGSGVLVADGGLGEVKAATVSSRKWGWVQEAADGRDVVRLSLGRAGDGLVAGSDDDALLAAALGGLQRLLGHAGADPAPVRALNADRDAVVTRWPQALPQYDVGHLTRVAQVRAAVAGAPAPLALAGSVLDGVGVAACVATAGAAAADVTARLREERPAWRREPRDG